MCIPFAVFDIDPAVLQVHAAGTQAFHLGAFQLHAGLQRFQNEVFMARFTVGGDGFGRRTLFGGCHGARLLSPFRFVVSVYHVSSDFQEDFLKKL